MTPFWAVLRTQMRREPIAAQAVLAKGIEPYLPLLPPARASRPEQPLFPGYIFASVKPESDDLLRIRSAPGIAYVLPPAGPPALLADDIVHQIRSRLAMSSDELEARRLQRGDRVTIVSGPLRWHDALFDRHLSSAGRVRILLELVQRTIVVDIDQAQLKRVV